jgi:acyl phosphate:glycerol-3-phosphate acyltransferase
MPVTFIVWLHSLSIVVAAYLLGSIPTGYLLMRFFRKQDIRTLGSGNIGATNVLRSGAKGLGAATFLLDVLKGALAVVVGERLAALGSPAIHPHEAAALAALCAVLGHMFPIWLGLRGGKGVATAFGVFIVLVPWAALGSLAVFAVVFALGRFVSLASILGAAAFPLFAWFAAPWFAAPRLAASQFAAPPFAAPPSVVPWTHDPLVIVITCLVAGLILIKHRENIERLLAGTEYRFGSSKRPVGGPAPGRAKDTE